MHEREWEGGEDDCVREGVMQGRGLLGVTTVSTV